MASKSRFAKHLLLKEIGQKGQEKFAAARVLIIGLGGLGSPLIRYLAAAGVGHFILYDDDIIEIDNLPRQNNYNLQDLDQSKIDISTQLIKQLNPEAQVTSYYKKATAKSLAALTDSYDYLVDATDNFATKFMLNKLALEQGKILVSGSFTGFKGYAAIYKAGLVKDLPCYACLHPENLSAETEQACYKQGVFSAGVGVVGTFMAAELLKEIASINSSAGQLMIFDFLTNQQRMVKLAKRPDCICC